MKEKTKKKKILVSVVTSICSTAALILTSNSDLQVINTRCLWVLGCIYLALGWYFLFWNYDLAQFATIRNRMRQVIVVFCSVLIACFLFTVLPLKQGMILKNQYYQKELAGSQTAQIRTLGEKNQKASGYQVWLEGIRFGGSDLNLYELQLPEGWEFREDRPYTQQQAESELIIPLSAEPDYTLMIRRGPDAGMVKVTIGRQDVCCRPVCRTGGTKGRGRFETGSFKRLSAACVFVGARAVQCSIYIEFVDACIYRFGSSVSILRKGKTFKEYRGAS